MLHVAQISFFVDRERRQPEQLLIDWHSLADVAQAAATARQRVTVVQASMVEGRLERDGVEFHFIAPDAADALLTRSTKFAALLRRLAADVFHVHGLGFGREVLGLRALMPHTPILLQDHADGVPHFWRWPLWRRGLAAAAGVFFCARAQAGPFVRARLLASRTPVFEVPESTTTFTPGERHAARALTGVYGDPAVLWVGHLNRNKDPLTVLNAVAAAAADFPRMKLWCCYGSAPLLELVRAHIATNPMLRERVHLLGRVQRDQVQQLMRAADLFVLASHREGGSFSLTEALATGLPAAVSDIPSSRALLGDGPDAPGVLWPCGDARALADALRDLARRPREKLRAQARAHFVDHLSTVAIGRLLAAAYESCAHTRLA